MRRLLTTFIAIFAFIVSGAQEIDKEPNGGLPVESDAELAKCIMAIDAFPQGFYWADVNGNSWWVLPNPIHRVGDTNLLQVNAFLFYNVRTLAFQEGWRVYYSFDEYFDTPETSESHPPVFLQSDNRDKNNHQALR